MVVQKDIGQQFIKQKQSAPLSHITITTLHFVFVWITITKINVYNFVFVQRLLWDKVVVAVIKLYVCLHPKYWIPLTEKNSITFPDSLLSKALKYNNIIHFLSNDKHHVS